LAGRRTSGKNEQMLIEAIGDLLPSALAVALSPIPIVAIVLMLGTPQARSVGPAFALGWVLGLLAVSLVVLLVLGGDSGGGDASSGVHWLKVAVGLLFLYMAAKQWSKRPSPGQEPEMPAWMKTVDRVDPRRAVALGAALSGINPKNLALTLTAVATIAQSGLSTTDEAIATAVFIIIGSTTVAGAALFYLLAGRRAAAPLASIKAFMAENNAVIMMIVLLLLGAKLLGDGLGVL
jgi:threonine/homoserine/homoserine lactone efflux protein